MAEVVTGGGSSFTMRRDSETAVKKFKTVGADSSPKIIRTHVHKFRFQRLNLVFDEEFQTRL